MTKPMADFSTRPAGLSAEKAPSAGAVGPRLKILFLLGTAVLAFCLRALRPLCALVALQGVLWAWNGVPAGELWKLVRRLSLFAAMLALTFGFFPVGALRDDVWRAAALGPLTLRVNETGLWLALLMTLRIAAVVMASTVVHATAEPSEYVEGLRGWLPETVAVALASTLALLHEEGGPRRHDGRGDGSGGGRGGRPRDEKGLWDLVQRLRRGELGGLVELLEGSLARARAHASGLSTTLPREKAEDIAVVSGISVLMLSAKLVRILPGIPFAPGYKVMLLVPLYILASALTSLRAPATLAGTIVGVLSFLSGDGRFGVFEILKHVFPGVVIDLAAPWLRGRTPTPRACVALGMLAAAARASTILAVAWYVEGNALLYGFAALQALSRVFFGAVGGLIAAGLLKELTRLREAARS